ncbi:olfactory receptor 52E4-like [Notechis scutatus]|uniref:Olfactory receptor 52E4-like n=1 Tax=Notechis scutatus TaxID=8663 RepID=A0A6J1VMG8_9SAUR|nr:olfactory receptor 52E4-like [Notechis scutatus]
MWSPNSTHFFSPMFVLLGVPGLEEAHGWLSIPFCAGFLIALLSNFTILSVVKTKASLHQPMFYFLCLLSFVNLGLSISTLPKMLAISPFGLSRMSFDVCLAQMFFIHTFTGMESMVLLTMAFNCYVATCDPLRYSTILTQATVIWICLSITLKPACLIFPMTVMSKHLPFCSAHINMPHTYCEHMGIAKLACTDIHDNVFYGLWVASFLVLELTLIAVSYTKILQAIFRLSSKEARLKSLSTCHSHIAVIFVFYTPALFSFLTHRFGHNIPHFAHILIANLYVILPLMLNPVIYGVRTKEIWTRVLQMLSHWETLREVTSPSGRRVVFDYLKGGEAEASHGLLRSQ